MGNKLKRIMYWTMNSWNRSESLAYNMKIYKLGFSGEIEDALYKFLDEDSILQNDITILIEAFGARFNYEWQAGFNGRSGGYLVLYQGGANVDGSVYCRPGLGATPDEVPTEVKKAFRTLALAIRKAAKTRALEYIKKCKLKAAQMRALAYIEKRKLRDNEVMIWAQK